MPNFLREFVKLAAFKVIYPLTYKLFCIRKQQGELTLFCEVRHDFLTDSFSPIYSELNRRGKPTRVFYIHNNSGGLSYLARYLKLCAILPTAGTVMIDDTCNLFGAFRLRKGSRLIQTWHSCGAFKKWGYSIASLSFGQEPKQLDRYPAHINYSLVTVSSDECIHCFNEAFGFDKTGKDCVKAIGVARSDWFFDKQNISGSYKRLYEACPAAEGKKVILYAPTYRGDADNAKAPEMFDIASLMERLDGYVLLIKQHGFVRERTRIDESCMDFAFDVSGKLTIEELICVSDVCITDYSSLIFEYSLFERPMVFYACDLDEFYDYRGFFYDYDESFLPGEIALTQKELFDAVQRAVDLSFDQDRIRSFRDRFMGACDGNSTKRIVEYILDKK
ncbi:MAG: CDP-glycerol glycerophosphotransferase family protein [Ruminococcus sp.]|nr:CDP-glycerol glycerophosphotransferase family protein [Ruminococcus sp.]